MRRKVIGFVIVIIITVGISLYSYNKGGEEVGEREHFKKINWYSFRDKETPPLIASIINFVVFAGIIYFAVRSSFKNYLEKRHLLIKERIEEANRLKQEFEEKYKEYTRKLEELDKSLERLKEEYRVLGERERDKIIGEAVLKGEKIKQDVKKVIEMEREHAKEELRQFAIELGVKVAEQLLKERLKDKDREELVDEYIRELTEKEFGR